MVIPVSKTFAAPPYPFTATINGNSIVAKMTNAPADATQYRLYNGNTPVASNDLVGPDTSIQTQTNGIVTWTISGLGFVNGVYTLHVEKVPAVGQITVFGGTNIVTADVSVTVNTSTTDFFLWPMNAVSATGQGIVLAGKIDTSQYPATNGLQVKIQYSTSANPSGGTELVAHSTLGSGSTEGVASDGSYYFELNSLTPKTKYYYRQTITATATNTVLSTKDLYFNSTDGYVPSGTLQQEEVEADRTYHLLAPWPGLSKLYDPALCQEKKDAGEIPVNSVCDVNGFINFAFKTLIGLTAVVLVLRLMFEGYQYMVTDVPFLKASAKGSFFSALMGLLLALGSYVILNTVNPKLVDNKFNIAGVNVGVEFTEFDAATFQSVSGRPIKAKAELLAIVKSTAQSKNIDSCIVQAIIQHESQWKENAVGCDENVKSNGVPSRTAFVQSGVTLSGTTFTPTSATSSVTNDSLVPGKKCYFDETKPGFNLDWRFSKGFGLGQTTIFPSNYNESSWFTDVKQGGVLWNNRSTVPTAKIKDLLQNPATQVNAIITIYKNNASTCLTDIQKSFAAYNGGSCGTTNANALAYGRSVKATYDLCKQNGG